MVKEIVSKEGELHFQRYRLLSTSRGSIYIHRISKSDLDQHMHDHPWHFKSLILSGSYSEKTSRYPKFNFSIIEDFKSGDVVKHDARDIHKLTLKTPVVWTLVLTSGRERIWGYRIAEKPGRGYQKWIDFQAYRQLKRAGQLPQ